MLEQLKQTKSTVEAEIRKLPLTLKTMALQKRKAELEEQLDNITNKIKLFSRETVYVGIK